VSVDVSGRASTTLMDITISMFPENANHIPFIQQMAERGYRLDSMTCQGRPYRGDQLKELLLETNREFSVDTGDDGGLSVASPETEFVFTYHGPDINPRPGYGAMLRRLLRFDMVRKKGEQYVFSGYFALLQVNVGDEDNVDYHFKIGISKHSDRTFFDLRESDDVIYTLEKQKPPLVPL